MEQVVLSPEETEISKKKGILRALAMGRKADSLTRNGRCIDRVNKFAIKNQENEKNVIIRSKL